MLQAHKNISQHLKTLQSRTRWGSAMPLILLLEVQISSGAPGPVLKVKHQPQDERDLSAPSETWQWTRHKFPYPFKLKSKNPEFKRIAKFRANIPKSISSNRNLISSFRKVDHNFTLLFDDETSSRLLQNWDVFFKSNFIKEASWLTSAPESCCLV